MALISDPLEMRLMSALKERGLASSAELQALTGKSQPSLSRLLSRLSAQGVVTVGRGRKTRYALCQPLLGLVHGQQPLWRHDLHGGVERWGTLTWLASSQVHVEGQGQEWLERGRLPWFLAPLRLEGYLGRRWARSSHLAQVLGTDLQQWSVEQQLYAAITELHDGPGAFTLGNPTGGPALTLDAQDDAQRGRRYDQLVAEESEQPLAGSSAAGEQAKFLVEVRVKAGDGVDDAGWQSLIVKFAPAPRGTPFGDRWHDLLHAEALALHTLAEAGEPVAPAHVVETARRSYLESSRFDRTLQHGRRHAVALTNIHEAFVPGARHHWPATCQTLAEQKLLSHDDAQRARLWWTFGHLIGNNDMHFGNLSLWADDPARPRFELAPCYDMLPMAYRPSEQRDDLGPTPLPLDRLSGVDAALWQQARELAERFWTSVADHSPCTAPFRAVAAANAERLRGLR